MYEQKKKKKISPNKKNTPGSLYVNFPISKNQFPFQILLQSLPFSRGSGMFLSSPVLFAGIIQIPILEPSQVLSRCTQNLARSAVQTSWIEINFQNVS